MAVEKKKEYDLSKTMPEVSDLVSHLSKTGTGKSKLTRLLELGSETDSLDVFLSNARKEMPSGTMEKIDGYWGTKDEKPTPQPAPQPEVEKKVMHPMPSNAPKKK